MARGSYRQPRQTVPKAMQTPEFGSRLADELGRRMGEKCPACGYSTAGHHPTCRKAKKSSP